MLYRSAFVLLSALLVPLNTTLADGERDNNPESVRRIPKKGVPVPEQRANSLRSGLAELQGKIAAIQKSKDPAKISLLPDLMIFERAVRVALDHDEFFDAKDIDKADKLLVEGMTRANQLMAGKPEWPNQSGLVVRGYISRIDHTVQPYGLVIPETYAFNHSVPTRCDLWFHGRGETLSEVNFIWDRMKNPGQYTPDHTIMLHPYGRYSNAFKFAGEVDVLEALEDAQQRYRIDEDRISVRGFSMGGAACWQFAVHYPDRWFAANPGAGFSETPQFLKFFQKETLNPTPWEKKLWNLYDCDKYAANLAHCPTIAYSGENDIQKQAADVMAARLNRHRIELRHVIGAGMGHKIDHDSKDVIEKVMASLAKRSRNTVPTQLRLETHTLKYNRMHWLTVDAIAEHWNPARFDARLVDEGRVRGSTIRVSTSNVRRLTIKLPPGTLPWRERMAVALSPGGRDARGKETLFEYRRLLSDGSFEATYSFDPDAGWTIVTDGDDALRKRHNLQGPIDDAFMDSFVFVRPTGKAANEAAGKWAEAELERAIVHWRRHFRGDARVVDDTDVTDELIESANLVLWGDPSSNSVMAKVADLLPVKWTAKQVAVGDKTYDATHHAPILIYPNPLNQNRYVVFNSSFTFRDYAYLNNARQVPMLPDWAIVDLRTPPGNVWPGKVVAADFFDEQWQLKE